MAFGPIQVLAIAFPGSRFTGEILPEVARLSEGGIIRLLDLLLVTKDEDGEISSLTISELSEQEHQELGALAGALLGLGAAGEEGAEAGALLGAEAAAEGELLGDPVDLAEELDPGDSLAVVLIEHHWAIPLREKVRGSGGRAVAEAWIQAEDLVALGEETARALAAVELVD
jgi:uncharacterized membrane protein